ncbi:MAG TPA: hypothetical protein VFX65_09575 [Candidatus Limnocylindrales bacterium]|nr:hypothetical protein [Candidatus Limnocylindrales bacterium]
MNEEYNVQDDHPGTQELRGRLEAYSSARLSPNRKASARIRMAVLEEARMRALEQSIGRARHRHGTGRGRAVALLLAAALTLAAAVGVAASGPGGPLYGARVWFETALLPADADERALERIRQIEERLVDAELAVESGDGSAVAAAIKAYREAVDAAMAEVGSDPERLARLQAALGLHVTVLETLSNKLPDAASNGIDRAREASQKALDRLKDAKPGSGQGPQPTEPAAAPTDKPAKTPKPAATPDPSVETPSHTRRGAPEGDQD